MKHPIWRAAPLLLAATFLASYASFVFGVPTVLSLFNDFKIEMPAPTIQSMQIARLVISPDIGWVCGVILLSLTFAIAIGEKWAYWLGLLITAIFGLWLLSFILPFIAVSNALTNEPSRAPALFPALPIIAVVALLPPLLFLVLRRAFWNKQSSPTQTLAR